MSSTAAMPQAAQHIIISLSSSALIMKNQYLRAPKKEFVAHHKKY
jgi:hypothetical protein